MESTHLLSSCDFRRVVTAASVIDLLVVIFSIGTTTLEARDEVKH